jgi:hypothetical protein
LVSIAGVFAFEVSYESIIGGFYLSAGQATAVDEAGNAFVAARWVGERDENNFVLLKLDPDGNELWRRVVSGYDHDIAADVAVDGDGDLWVTGWTDSEDFPLVEPTDAELTGFREIFLMEVSGSDGTILFSTFIGGDYRDEGAGIALTSAGHIVLVGLTESTDFPVVDAFQPDINSYPYDSSDAIVMRLSADGRTILYSSHLGGWKDDWASDVAVDDADNIYVVGRTVSVDFPLEAPLQAEHSGGGSDLFVSQLAADGQSLAYSTYLGGTDREIAGGISVSGGGVAFVSGSTRSPDFPTTAGAYQEEFVGAIKGCEVPFGADNNCDDQFVARLARDGSELTYSTFIGGTDVDLSRGVAIDSAGNAHLVGYTSSSDFPIDDIDADAEIVVVKLTVTGDAIADSRAVDSNSANQGHGIAIGSDDDVYFSGGIRVPAEIYVSRLDGASSGGGGSDGCGRITDQQDAGSAALTLEKADGDAITLSWGESCVATDDDYAIYEGTLGTYYDHAPRFCTTDGVLTKTFVPADGLHYYLVVPRNDLEEGSYGGDDAGNERPASTSSCQPQALGVCR